MLKDDLNQHHSPAPDGSGRYAQGEFSRSAKAVVRTIFGMTWKTFKTVLIILMITMLTVFVSVAGVILSFRDIDPPNIGMLSLNYSSFIKIQNQEGAFEDYITLHSNENRVWVDLKDIPQSMIDAMIAIEDRRFMEHNGVDWRTTGGAIYELASGGDGRGGSTLTQQLIKNVTDDDDVSIMRKVREIFTALNLEKQYTKDEIIEMYLNVVNFGSGANGVQAAANLYFGKDIIDCDIAQCAAIAGITQYPYLYTPLYSPEKNRERQQLVLQEMKEQGMITAEEYQTAFEESQHMVFVDYTETQEDETDRKATVTWNWYTETMVDEVIRDLQGAMNVSADQAANMLYKSGLEIYSAMDLEIQEGVEDLFTNEEYLPYDLEVQYGVSAMDYTGKMLAVVGSRQPKTADRVLNFATRSRRQTGSSIKALSVYAAGIENGYITYGSVLKDQKLPNYHGIGEPGPENFSKSNQGYMNVPYAIEISQNMPAAQLVDEMGVETSYKFLTERLGFNLEPEDETLSAMALGGFYSGATVQEMTAGFQIFGSGGVYHRPYSYYYVKDHDGNVILDNREQLGIQAMTPENARVMNELLHRPVYGDDGTARLIRIDGIDMFGKTGTTDSTYDLTFFGGTPLVVAGVWNGYADRQMPLYDPDTAKVMWRALIDYLHTNYSEKLKDSGYTLSDNVEVATYCRDSGLLAGRRCYNTAEGLYADTDYGMPDVCDGSGDHSSKRGGKKSSSSGAPSGAPTKAPAATKGPDESSKDVTPTPSASAAPSPSGGAPTAPPVVTNPPAPPPVVTDPPAPPPVVTDPPAVVTDPPSVVTDPPPDPQPDPDPLPDPDPDIPDFLD